MVIRILSFCFMREIACAACDDGKLSISHDVPLSVWDIARGCGRRRTVIEKALRVFSECGIVTIEEETGMIRLTDWDDMQSLCKDEKRREQTRQRVAIRGSLAQHRRSWPRVWQNWNPFGQWIRLWQPLTWQKVEVEDISDI